MNLPVISFNAGKLTPQADVRSDVEKYSSGCRILDNMIPRIYGCAERRPGSKYIYTAKSGSVKARVVPFIYSSTVAYIVEIGNLYMRFYNDGGILLDGATPVEIITPYLEADLYALQFEQIADVMWITHPSYAQRKLKRVSPVAFTLEEIVISNGPFLIRNDLDKDDDVTMTPSVITLNASGILTASANTFKAGHVGALFKLTQPRVDVSETVTKTGSSTGASSADGINVKGDFSFNISSATAGWVGTVKLERMEDGTNWETYRTYIAGRNVILNATEEADNIQYRINVSAHTSGTIDADITVNSSTQDGIVRIDSYTSATVLNMTVLVVLASTDATKRWAEGAWSAEQGYPTTITFFEERAVYAGTSSNAQTLWLSETGDFEDFEEGVKDSDSFSLVLPSTEGIRWVESLEALVVGTAGGEWRIRATSIDDALTPTNYNIRQQTAYGSASIQAVKINEAVLFVDFPARKVREMTFRDDKQKFVAPDLTALAEDITAGGITSIAYQRNPDSILWCTISDSPYLISMTYEREQDVVAWANHPFGGSGIVESVAVIPGDNESEVWASVQRTINTATVRYIEQLQPRDWGSGDEDAFFVDSGLTYDGAATLTLSGLDHLEGETVSVLGNGAVFTPVVVVTGEITLPETVTKAHAGLPYTYQVEPMRLDVSTGEGTTHGSIKKIAEAVISFFKTLNARYGDGTDTYDIDWRKEEVYGSPPDLFTGDKTVSFDGGFSTEDTFIISGSDPLPCTVRAIILRTEKTGR